VSIPYNPMALAWFFAIAIVLTLIIVYVIHMRETALQVNIDGNNYKILGSYDDHKEAAKNLAILNEKIMDFFKYLKNKYQVNTVYGPNYMGTSDHKRSIVMRILQNYNPEVIEENDPKYSKDTSYTVSKGRELHVCLRQKVPPYRLHSLNEMMFVLLHEISHMGNATYGHREDFWSVFKFVLSEARQHGIYDPVNYEKNPIVYCGLKVNYSPYYDNEIPNV
jgi:hypothetical protein